MTLQNSQPFSIKISALTIFVFAAMLNPSFAKAETVYGPVKPNDTLSKIIKRLYTGPRSKQLSVMKQIVVNNPSAFLNGDMNRLKLNASLSLPGERWKNLSLLNQPLTKRSPQGVKSRLVEAESIDRSAPNLSVEQMKGRIVFLDAERSSLIEEVANLKRETSRLEKKVLKLEAGSKLSDEQLRILDAEIIRLTDVLKSNELKFSSVDLNQLVVLQEKLRLVQAETSQLKSELSDTKTKLAKNDASSMQANQTIAKLTQENRNLQKLLQDNQPGVNYFDNTANESNISLLSGKLQLPVGMIVVGSALLALMLITLIATRRKKPSPIEMVEDNSMDPFSDTPSYSALLETDDLENESKGYAPAHIQPEENVFKMFDEGTLEMDLKLDMAEAYLQVSDFDSARSILQEVVEGGSELQKRKAARLIKKAA